MKNKFKDFFSKKKETILKEKTEESPAATTMKQTK